VIIKIKTIAFFIRFLLSLYRRTHAEARHCSSSPDRAYDRLGRFIRDHQDQNHSFLYSLPSFFIPSCQKRTTLDDRDDPLPLLLLGILPLGGEGGPDLWTIRAPHRMQAAPRVVR
jgi:hypothetical protein